MIENIEKKTMPKGAKKYSSVLAELIDGNQIAEDISISLKKKTKLLWEIEIYIYLSNYFINYKLVKRILYYNIAIFIFVLSRT